jgi:eukaryotic-like serine/threonine-protein kinase
VLLQSESTDEDSRELLQRRLSRFGKVTFVLSASFYPLGAFVRAKLGFAAEQRFAGALGDANVWHAAATLVFLAVWLGTRTGRRSFPALHAIDALMTVAGASALMMIAMANPPWTRPDTFSLLIVSRILALRAALIPSTALRTAVTAGAALTPILVTTYLYYGSYAAPSLPSPARMAMNAAIWSALVVAVTATLSRTVHGLRARVRAAMKLGPYTLGDKLGQGGMGVVYRASHALLRRPTAVKLLLPERAGEQNLARFEREVQLTSQLTHPNTISVYDFGRTPEGTFYYAMEYLDGVDLETLVSRDGPQDPARAAHVLAQICGALAEAHGVGLIHRDIKPANVILCRRGGIPDVIKVLDFGLTKELGAPEQSMQSESRSIVGTPLYISPEAVVAPASVDGRSDLYAVGAVGYYLVAGEPPFSGTSVVELCSHHVHTPPVPPSVRARRDVPAQLEHLILACLAKSPNDRPTSAAALGEALQPLGLDWTRERAERWWSERGAVLAARRPEAPAAVASSAKPLAVTRVLE